MPPKWIHPKDGREVLNDLMRILILADTNTDVAMARDRPRIDVDYALRDLKKRLLRSGYRVLPS